MKKTRDNSKGIYVTVFKRRLKNIVEQQLEVIDEIEKVEL